MIDLLIVFLLGLFPATAAPAQTQAQTHDGCLVSGTIMHCTDGFVFPLPPLPQVP